MDLACFVCGESLILLPQGIPEKVLRRCIDALEQVKQDFICEVCVTEVDDARMLSAEPIDEESADVSDPPRPRVA